MTTEDLDERSYQAWGVIVSTSNVRGAHIANGIVQLLRLAPEPVPWDSSSGTTSPGSYLKATREALKDRFGERHDLTSAQRAFCVTGFKHGRIRFDHPAGTDFEPSTQGEKRLTSQIKKIVEAGRTHLKDQLRLSEMDVQPDVHEAICSVLNADDRVKISGASDPTAPGFVLSGITSTHTLKGMHAATFLGLLAATERGTRVIKQIYNLLRDDEHDPHSALVNILRLSAAEPSAETIAPVPGLYPLPQGEGWRKWAEVAGKMTDRLMTWSGVGASKAETWAAIIDLATLILALRLLRWREHDEETDKLILVISESESSGQLRTLIERAQVSLQGISAGLDEAARANNLVRESKKDDKRYYSPAAHALNLAGSGGWLRPHDSRGGAKRYFAPGPRQLTTLVRSLVSPDDGAISWAEFASRAEELGLAFGGFREHETARRLHSLGGAATVRSAGIVNKKHFVSLGLARKESDDVVRVDGGGDEQQH